MCEELRAAMTTIHRAKQAGGGVPSADDQPIVDEAATHGTLQFVSLKKLNRVAHFRAKKVRDATADAKQRVDAQHLRLQNLLYEARSAVVQVLLPIPTISNFAKLALNFSI